MVRGAEIWLRRHLSKSQVTTFISLYNNNTREVTQNFIMAPARLNVLVYTGWTCSHSSHGIPLTDSLRPWYNRRVCKALYLVSPSTSRTKLCCHTNYREHRPQRTLAGDMCSAGLPRRRRSWLLPGFEW